MQGVKGPGAHSIFEANLALRLHFRTQKLVSTRTESVAPGAHMAWFIAGWAHISALARSSSLRLRIANSAQEGMRLGWRRDVSIQLRSRCEVRAIDSLHGVVVAANICARKRNTSKGTLF